MKNNLVKALKKLVTSFGGSAESNNAVDLVDEFADVAAQGSSGGGGVLICTDTKGTLDKTMGEIQTAFLNGMKVLIKREIYYFSIFRFSSVHEHEVGVSYKGQLMFLQYEENGSIAIERYGVTESTEEAALSAYPTFVLNQ